MFTQEPCCCHYVEVKAGADLNARSRFGYTPLHRAAAFSQTLAVTAALLAAGADPNAGNQFGAKPLGTRRLSTTGTLAVIAALLEAGADPNARDDNGKTPVDMAHKNKNPAVLSTLEKAAGR